MPFFDFECKDCGKMSEDKLVRRSDTEAVECEHCGSTNVVQQISAPSGLSFHGSGFYETEHGSQKHNKNK